MPRKPVVFVPGLPGTRLHDTYTGRDVFPPSLPQLVGSDRAVVLERLRGPEDPDRFDGVVAMAPVRHSARLLGMDMGKQAESLYDILRDLGYEVFDDPLVHPVGWDWRKPVYGKETLERLRSAVESLAREAAAPVTLIAHSTGGLVVRALLEAHPGIVDGIEHLIAIGVPWAGTLKPLRYIAHGEPFAGGLIGAEESRAVLARSHAAYDLLPLGPQDDPSHNPPGMFFDDTNTFASPLVAIGWLPEELRSYATRSQERMGRRGPALPAGADGRLAVTNLVGWGRITDTYSEIKKQGSVVTVAISQSDDGDGTVPRRSAAWLRGDTIRTFHVPFGSYGGGPVSGHHAQLWDAPPARMLIEQILAGTPRTPFLYTAFEPDDLMGRAAKVRIRVVGLDPDGRPLENANAYFPAVGARPRSKDHAFDSWGRATLAFPRDGSPELGNAYYCPVVVEWTFRGEPLARRFELSFLA